MITLHPFGSLPDGQAVTRYRLENQQGAYADILDYGGIIQSLWVPDRTGALVDVSLGYDDLSGYLQGSAHLGASLGRYANRICGASFPLLGKTISLTPNSGDNCLHGGSKALTGICGQPRSKGIPWPCAVPLRMGRRASPAICRRRSPIPCCRTTACGSPIRPKRTCPPW